MALIIGVTNRDVQADAATIQGSLVSLHGQLTAWRASIAASNETRGGQTRTVFHLLTAYRKQIVDIIAASDGGLLAAIYLAQFKDAPGGYDVGAEWTATKTEIDSLISWLKTAWPHKTASGHPAWDQFQASTDLLIDLVVPITGAAKTDALARIDAVLARFA